MDYEKITNADLSDNYNTVMLSSHVRFGFDYALSDHMHLHLESCYGIGLTRIVNAPDATHLPDVELNVGCFVCL